MKIVFTILAVLCIVLISVFVADAIDLYKQTKKNRHSSFRC